MASSEPPSASPGAAEPTLASTAGSAAAGRATCVIISFLAARAMSPDGGDPFAHVVGLRCSGGESSTVAWSPCVPAASAAPLPAAAPIRRLCRYRMKADWASGAATGTASITMSSAAAAAAPLPACCAGISASWAGRLIELPSPSVSKLSLLLGSGARRRLFSGGGLSSWLASSSKSISWYAAIALPP